MKIDVFPACGKFHAPDMCELGASTGRAPKRDKNMYGPPQHKMMERPEKSKATKFKRRPKEY